MKKLICFGDSLTARCEGFAQPMLTTMLSTLLTSYKIINAGVSGNNTDDARKRLETDVLQKNPDMVTVFFGANDAASHKNVHTQRYEENLRAIVQSISPSKTLLITPAPVDESLQQTRTNRVMADYAQIVLNIASDTDCYAIDFFDYMINQPNYTDLLRGQLNDGLHFGESAYTHLSGLIAEKLLMIANKKRF